MVIWVYGWLEFLSLTYPPAPQQEFQFRGIQKAEWQTLFDFISAKGLRIENLEETERGPGGGGRAINLDLGDDIDQGEPPTESPTIQQLLSSF